jgi:hypothetical protein
MHKKIYPFICSLLLLPFLANAQSKPDSAKIQRDIFIKAQTVKADSLNEAALKLAHPNANAADLNRAIENIMTGLHVYSKFRDSIGLVKTFDHLGLVYHLQKKYAQAKWFILQSNTMSRQKRDTINIIHSLVNLASVKEDIKDFSLAKRDLTEALAMAKALPKVDAQVEVQKALSRYFTKIGDTNNSAIAINRAKVLTESANAQMITRENHPIKNPGTVDSVAFKPQQQAKAEANESSGKQIIIGIRGKDSRKDKSGLS